jgi:hypothetical protein
MRVFQYPDLVLTDITVLVDRTGGAGFPSDVPDAARDSGGSTNSAGMLAVKSVGNKKRGT